MPGPQCSIRCDRMILGSGSAETIGSESFPDNEEPHISVAREWKVPSSRGICHGCVWELISVTLALQTIIALPKDAGRSVKGGLRS